MRSFIQFRMIKWQYQIIWSQLMHCIVRVFNVVEDSFRCIVLGREKTRDAFSILIEFDINYLAHPNSENNSSHMSRLCWSMCRKITMTMSISLSSIMNRNDGSFFFGLIRLMKLTKHVQSSRSSRPWPFSYLLDMCQTVKKRPSTMIKTAGVELVLCVCVSYNTW